MKFFEGENKKGLELFSSASPRAVSATNGPQAVDRQAKIKLPAWP
ncbi:MAG TPA: hypothetical protein VLK60_06150 [Variovorax sp.]|nr:hypothetical protein [Variovorax sp.]